MKNKILLLGSSGFIGKKLKDQLILHYNNSNFCFVNKKKFLNNFNTFSSNNLSIISKNYLKKFNIIINCAGEVLNVHEMKRSNTLLLKKVIQNINHKCLFIHVSSCALYGKSNFNKKINFTENMEIPSKNFQNNYQMSKFYSEKIIIKKNLLYKKFSYIIFRPSQVIDISMPNDAIRRLKYYANNFFFIYFGYQKTIKSYISLKDLVRAIHLVVKRPKKTNVVYNISQGIALSVIIQNVNIKKYFNFSLRVPIFFIKIILILINFINNFKIRKIPLTSNILDGLSTTSTFDSTLFLKDYPNFKFLRIEDEIKKI